MRFNYKWTIKDSTFTKDKGTVFSCFSGGGGSSMGYLLSGYNVLGCNEIDQKMIDSYIANLNPKFVFKQPIQKFRRLKNLPAELYNLDILDGSPPCFVGETPVLTDKGFVPIRKIKVGDYVLTHKNRFQMVTAVNSKVTDKTVEIDSFIENTVDHRYLARIPTKEYAYKKNMGEPEWVNAENLHKVFLCTPNQIKETRIPNPPKNYNYSTDFWYMVGRWLGDGWLRIVENNDANYRYQQRYNEKQMPCLCCKLPSRQHKRYETQWTAYCSEQCRKKYARLLRKKQRYTVIICASYSEYRDLYKKMKKVHNNITVSYEKTVVKLSISSKYLAYWFLKFFKSGAKNKTIPSFVLSSLPIAYKKALFKGYVDSDGHISDNGIITASISKCLTSGMYLLGNSLGYNVSITKRAENTNIIEGRKVNTNISWSLRYKKNKERYCVNDGAKKWKLHRKKINIAHQRKRVYDLTVKSDHSFLAGMYFVHNCSSFTNAGNRAKDWGRKRKFSEGEYEQVLDVLFFEFIALAKKLQPKIVVAENVPGITFGKAIDYVKRIYEHFDKAGYYSNYWMLDSSTMGVPQKRKRVFFIAMRKDLAELFPNKLNLNNHLPNLVLRFKHKPILAKEILDQPDDEYQELSDTFQNHWKKTKIGKYVGNFQSGRQKISPNQVCPVVSSVDYPLFHPFKMRTLGKKEIFVIHTFPLDYKLVNQKRYNYIPSMSVPPVMMAYIADEIHKQWLIKIKEYENQSNRIKKGIRNR